MVVRQGAFPLLLIILSTLCAGLLHAQPNVEVFWLPTNRADTVMDFGVTLEGFPVRLPFHVINHDVVPVGILPTNSQAEPYYAIVNTPALPPPHQMKDEFERVGSLPYIVQPGDTGSFEVEYQAWTGSPGHPPDSVATALLEIRVVKMTDSLGPAIFRRFLLRALKTRYALATTTPLIRFDSVYVNPQPKPPQEPYAVTNASSLAIPVERQVLDFKTSVSGDAEILIDTLRDAVFAPRTSLLWNVEYKPHNMGKDSAHFHVVYRPNPGSETDSVTLRVSGTGVLQQIAVDSANAVPPSVVVRGDTIDFGDVDADGSGGKLARIIVRNTGNINVRYTSEREVGTVGDTLAYQIERSLQSGGSDLLTNAWDTLLVRFAPVNGGPHIIQYVIETDLMSRQVKGVPDGAHQRVFTFRGFARKPQMAVLPTSVDFGPVVLLPACSSAVERTVVVRNVGNILLRIDSVRVHPPTSAITVNPPEPIPAIEVDGSQTLIVRYQPAQIEQLSAFLVLYTNAFGPPVHIPLAGSAIGADTITVSVPSQALRPGSTLALPIHVDADRVMLAQTSKLTLSFDPSQLRYRGLITGGTSTEGATVLNSAENPRGVLKLEFEANGSFAERDTFVIVVFDTYLGTNAATELALNSSTTQFGNAGCASILRVTTVNGTFAADSVCGLPFKTATNGTLNMSIAPLPAGNEVHVTVESSTGQAVQLALYDTYGTLLSTFEGRPHTRIDLQALPVGLYVLVARSGGLWRERVIVHQ